MGLFCFVLTNMHRLIINNKHFNTYQKFIKVRVKQFSNFLVVDSMGVLSHFSSESKLCKTMTVLVKLFCKSIVNFFFI